MPTTAPPNSVTEWIAQMLSGQRLNAQSLIVTMLGDAVAPYGGLIWLKSLIQLAAPLGLNERLVRTSVFRLAAEGWLSANRQGRRSEYQLTPQGFSRFEQAHHRIYTVAPQAWDGEWTLVLLPPGEAPARQQLRRELEWEGFVALTPTVLAHPAPRREAVGGIVERLAMRDQVYVLSAREAVPLRGRPLAAFAQQAWSLDALAEEYRALMQGFSPLLQLVEQTNEYGRGQNCTLEQAFVVRTLLIHQFRRVHLRDPQLPQALLPPDWPGPLAYKLSGAIYRQVYAAANAHVLAVLEAESGFVPPLTPYFFQRFGGLLNQLA